MLIDGRFNFHLNLSHIVFAGQVLQYCAEGR